MTTLTAYNEQIIKWTKKPSEEKAKPAKEIRLSLFKKMFISAKGIFEKAFTAARIRVLDEVIYKSVETGVYHANCATIADNCGLSVKTVERAVAHIKQSNQFVIGYAANGRKGGYIFVDRLHKNFKKIMFSLFPNNAANFFKSELESELESEHQNGDKPTESSDKHTESSDKPTASKVRVLKIEKPTISSGSSSLKQANNNKYIYNARACAYVGKELKSQDQKQSEYVEQWATNENQKVLFNRIKMVKDGLLPCINEQAHIIALRIGEEATPATVVQAMDILVDLTERKLNHTLMLNCKLDATTVVKVFHGQLTAKLSRKPVQAKPEPKKRMSAPVRLYNWLEEKAEQVVTTITKHPLADKFFNNYEDVDDMPF